MVPFHEHDVDHLLHNCHISHRNIGGRYQGRLCNRYYVTSNHNRVLHLASPLVFPSPRVSAWEVRRQLAHADYPDQLVHVEGGAGNDVTIVVILDVCCLCGADILDAGYPQEMAPLDPAVQCCDACRAKQ